MQGYRLCVNYVLVVGMLTVLFPNISKASNEQGEMKLVGQKVVPAEGRADGAVAVISVHFGESAGASKEDAAEKLGRWLEREKVQIVDAAVLQERLHARQAKPGDSKVIAEFKTIGAVVTQGTEDFYYKGNEAALEVLKPVFDISGGGQSDAPACGNCGHIMVRSGTCYKCLNCGTQGGCS